MHPTRYFNPLKQQESNSTKTLTISKNHGIFYAGFSKRGRSSIWLERRPVTPEAAGSSPVGPALEKTLFIHRVFFCRFNPEPVDKSRNIS